MNQRFLGSSLEPLTVASIILRVLLGASKKFRYPRYQGRRVQVHLAVYLMVEYCPLERDVTARRDRPSIFAISRNHPPPTSSAHSTQRMSHSYNGYSRDTKLNIEVIHDVV